MPRQLQATSEGTQKQKPLTVMITFDEKGHVYPYKVIEMTLEEFRQIFVEGLENQERRRMLFAKYLQFLEDLKKVFPIPFFQWIDGSFTTLKSIPGDIDVVSFIDYDQIVRNAGFIHHFTENARKLYEVDAHFASTASWRHRFRERAETDEIYWKNIFGFSREDKNFKRHPKGIIKIKF